MEKTLEDKQWLNEAEAESKSKEFNDDDFENLFDKIDDEKTRYSTEESLQWSAYKIGFIDGCKAILNQQ